MEHCRRFNHLGVIGSECSHVHGLLQIFFVDRHLDCDMWQSLVNLFGRRWLNSRVEPRVFMVLRNGAKPTRGALDGRNIK